MFYNSLNSMYVLIKIKEISFFTGISKAESIRLGNILF